MAVTATSYAAQVLAAAINLLADSTTWRGLVGAANAAAAKAKIIENDGGDLGDGMMVNCLGNRVALAPPLAVAFTAPARRRRIDTDQWSRSGTVSIDLGLPMTASDSPPEMHRRMINAVDGILDDLEDIALDGRLNVNDLSASDVAMGDPNGVFAGCVTSTITLAWSIP